MIPQPFQRLAGSLVAALVGLAPAAHAAPGPCEGGGAPVRVVEVNERLELELADGTVALLAGLDMARPTPTDPALGERVRAAMTGWLGGRVVLVRALAPGADRWGRVVATVSAEATYDDATPDAAPALTPVGVAAIALEAGWARVRPDAVTAACAPDWLAIEADAREAALGLWADPYYAVFDPTDQALAARAGSMVLVEGEVRSVGEGRARLYLNFERSRGRSFSVTMLKRSMTSIEKAGLAIRSLAGAIVRVRGVLDTRYGPQVDLTRADQVEVIAAPGAR